MVQHIVMWNFKEGFSQEENIENAKKVKAELEAIGPKIEGVVSLEVVITPLSYSNRDVVLLSKFKDEAALVHYQSHPEHVRVGQFVRSVLENRACVDWVEE